MLDTVSEPAFTNAQALTTLLGAEGFLLAAVALSINLSNPGQQFARKGWMSFRKVTIGAAFVLLVAAVGAGFAWANIFLRGATYAGHVEATIAVALAIVIVAQPIIALTLALGAGTE